MTKEAKIERKKEAEKDEHEERWKKYAPKYFKFLLREKYKIKLIVIVNI